jgi:hypothetical protein
METYYSIEDDNMRYCYGMLNRQRFECYLESVGTDEFTEENIDELVADTIIDIESMFGNEMDLEPMRQKLNSIARKFITDHMRNV